MLASTDLPVIIDGDQYVLQSLTDTVNIREVADDRCFPTLKTYELNVSVTGDRSHTTSSFSSFHVLR